MAQKLEAVGIVIALCEINGHRRFGQLLLLIVHQDARIEGLHVDLFGVLDLDGLLRPAAEREMLRGLVADEVIDRREEIEHSLMGKKPLPVKRRYVLAINLADER